MRPWLGRLSFTFLIIAFFLAWQAYKGATGQLGPISAGRVLLYGFGAMCSFVLGFMGVRERHRPRDD